MVLILFSCGGEKQKTPANKTNNAVTTNKSIDNNVDLSNKGIGPIKEVKLDDNIDDARAKRGQKIYDEKCKACHKEYKKYIGPPPVGVLNRRSPEWIMNMILNPEEMVKKDPIAKGLLKKFVSPMANQHLTKEEARDVLEYFRTLKEK